MKRNIKTYILGFITGAVIFSSIGVVAYSLNARDISFKPTNPNWNVDNLEDAMNDLYENANECVYGTFICDSDCMSSNGKVILNNFIPSRFGIWSKKSYSNKNVFIFFEYDVNNDPDYVYDWANDRATLEPNKNEIGKYMSLNNNTIMVKDIAWDSRILNSTWYYYACK